MSWSSHLSVAIRFIRKLQPCHYPAYHTLKFAKFHLVPTSERLFDGKLLLRQGQQITQVILVLPNPFQPFPQA